MYRPRSPYLTSALRTLPTLPASTRVNSALGRRLARAALEAGQVVACEKPVALDSAGAAELVAAAERTGRVATVPFVYRYYPTVREARAHRHFRHTPAEPPTNAEREPTLPTPFARSVSPWTIRTLATGTCSTSVMSWE